MADWSSEQIREVIIKIRDGEFVLPVIQRRLVWKEEAMTNLFNSVLKGHSFGAIIGLEEEKNAIPLFAFREFTKDGSPCSASMPNAPLPHKQFFVIDGQQRLQSFYIGLLGSLNGNIMYFDLYSDFQDEEYDFIFAPPSGDKLPKVNRERAERNLNLRQNEISLLKECLWYPVKDLYERLSKTDDSDEVADYIVKHYEINDTSQEKHIRRNAAKFYKSIFSSRSIGISKVTVNASKNEIENRQKMVELFRRLNDGGTRLSALDLVASTLKGFDYHMEKFLDDNVKEYENIGIGQDELIKLIFILKDAPSREITDLDATIADFAIKSSARIQKTLETLKKFLEFSNNYHWFASAKNRSAIPLYILAYHIFHSQESDENLPAMFDNHDTGNINYVNMKKWLSISLLNSIFSRGCGWIPYKTGIKKLHDELKNHKGKIFPINELFKVCTGHPLHIFITKADSSNINIFDRDYLFYLIYNGSSGFRAEDVDHIHPKKLLADKNFSDELINNVANFELLDSGTNRNEKRARALNDWINNCVVDKNSYTERHLIPKNEKLWQTDNFEEFLNERSKMIADKINNAI